MQKRYLRIVQYFIATILSVCIMVIIGIHVYVNTHKKEMLRNIEQQFQRNFYGSISVADIQADFWQKFPSVCLVLQQVVIRDTNWQQHHHDFLQAQNIFVQIENLPLLRGKLRIKRMILSKGNLYFFEDEHYYSNKSIFEKKRPETQKQPHLMQGIELNDFDLHYVHYHRKKDFHCTIDYLSTNINSAHPLRQFNSKGHIYIRQCCFNTTKGSYVQNEPVDLNIQYSYNTKTQQLQFAHQKVVVHKNELQFDALFFLQEKADSFQLNITAKQLNYATAIGLLSPNIHKRLDSFMIDGTLKAQINITGKLKHQAKPWIRVEGQVENNTVRTHFYQFEHCAFHIQYQNSTLNDSIPSEEKAQLVLSKIKATFKDVPISAENAVISNLKAPYMQTRIKANFQAQLLNRIISKKSFVIQKGRALLDLSIAMGVKWNDTRTKQVQGSIQLHNLDFSYLPRQIQFNNSTLNLLLDSNQIELKESILNTDKSQIKVAAIARQFTKNFIQNPERIRIDATIKSDYIDFNEFQHFLHKRTLATIHHTERLHSFADDIDKAFDASSTHINIAVQSLVFKQFKAQQIQADILMAPQMIRLNKMSLAHSEGQSNIHGYINEANAHYSDFHLYSKLQKASISALLYSCSNFGQKTFTSDNTQGIISMENDLQGQFDEKGHLMRNTLLGSCRFTIERGCLNQFTPLERMGRILFKKKRLSKVQFGQIKNNLSIKGEAISIPPMFIKTDLISMQVQGIFHLNKGTDLQIEIPLFKEDAQQLNDHSGADFRSNYRLHVAAKEDQEGKMNWHWHIQNNAIAAARAESKRLKAQRKKPHSK